MTGMQNGKRKPVKTTSAEVPSPDLRSWSKVLRVVRQVSVATAVKKVFYGLSVLARLTPWLHPKSLGIEVLKDIPYLPTGMREHTLDIYRTAGAKKAPVIFYVHGGGFWMLSKDTHWLIAMMFATQGYTVVSVNYRLAPQYRFPAAIEDVCKAFVWVTKNIEAYGGDLNHILFAGESAGANLVTALTLCTNYKRPEHFAKDVFATGVTPKGVLPACGILQVSDTDRFLRDNPKLTWLHFDRIRECENYYLYGAADPHMRTPLASLDLADPLVFLEAGEAPHRPLPPFFVPVGLGDPLLSDTQRLEAALSRLKVPCEARYYPKGGHAFHAFIWKKLAHTCWTDMFEYMEKVRNA
jgi:acetyl esterase